MTKFTIWHLDPAAFTLHYDHPLLDALQQQGLTARLLTSRSIHENTPVPKDDEIFYFQTLNYSPFYMVNKVYWLRRMARGLHYVIDQWRLTRMVEAQKPDIIHIHWSLLPLLDYRVYGRWQQVGVRCVLTVHNIIPQESPPHVAKFYFPLYHQADALIIHSQRSRQALIEWSQQLFPQQNISSKIHVIPEGKIFNPVLVDSEEARHQLGIPADALVLMFFGIVGEYKGLPYLIEAFPRILEALPNAYLVIAGHLYQSYRWGRDELPKIAAAFSANMKLILEYIPEDELPTLFGAADVMVLPYIALTQSGAALTALSYGVPVVASDVGGIADLVRDGETGILVEPKHADQLAEAIIRLLKDEGLRQRMSENARRQVREEHAWESVSRKTIEVYQQVMG